MLADPTDAEREVLGAIPYQPNEAVLHTDRSLLPRRRRAWASWNFHLDDEPAGRTTVTYHMNRLQSLRAERELLRDAQPDGGDRPGQGHRDDPLRPPASTRRRGSRRSAAGPRSAGSRRTHYCGAYWGYGFHEDGVASARSASAPPSAASLA